jgi:c-di-GMP-binding flagellar brake protein YcgR
MSIGDLLNAVYFLERVVPRGSNEEEQLIATVEALRTEIARRQRRNNGAK